MPETGVPAEHPSRDYNPRVDLGPLGKLLILAGAILVGVGLLLVLVGKGWIPRLPGDLSFTIGPVKVFFPIVTSIVLSIILTVILTLFTRR